MADVPVDPQLRGSGLRSVLGDSLVYGLSVAAMPAALAVATPVVARKLDPDGYGTLEVLTALVGLTSLVSLLGVDAAVTRSYFGYRGDQTEERERVIRTAVTAAICSSLAAVAILAAGLLAARLGGWRPSASVVAAGAAAALTIPLANAHAIARMSFLLERRRTRYVTAGVLQAAVGVATAIALVLLGAGPAGFFAGLAVGAATGLAYTISGSPIARRRAAWLDREELRIMLRYGLPLVPASAAIWVVFAVDRTIVAALRDLTEAGYYGLASKVTVPMMLLVTAFAIAWGPFVLRQEERRQRELQARALTAVTAGAAALFVCVVVFAGQLVALAGGATFEPSTRAVPGIALGWLGWAAATVLSTHFAVTRRTRVIGAMNAIAAAVNVVLNLVLVPAYGFTGAAWATAASFLLLALGYWLWERRGESPPYRYGRLAGVAVVAGAATAALGLGDSSADLAAKAGVCALAVALLAAIAASDRAAGAASFALDRR